MNVRLVKVDEKQFKTCIDKNLWGSNNISINKWEIGDLLIFKVNNQLAAIAEVSGVSYEDDEIIWDNGLFWNRIPIVFKHILSTNDRLPMPEKIIGMLMDQWGLNYGWGILNKQPLLDKTADFIISEIKSRPNAI